MSKRKDTNNGPNTKRQRISQICIGCNAECDGNVGHSWSCAHEDCKSTHSVCSKCWSLAGPTLEPPLHMCTSCDELFCVQHVAPQSSIASKDGVHIEKWLTKKSPRLVQEFRASKGICTSCAKSKSEVFCSGCTKLKSASTPASKPKGPLISRSHYESYIDSTVNLQKTMKKIDAATKKYMTLFSKLTNMPPEADGYASLKTKVQNAREEGLALEKSLKKLQETFKRASASVLPQFTKVDLTKSP